MAVLRHLLIHGVYHKENHLQNGGVPMPEPELREHREERIAVIRPEWGEIQHLHPSADNRTCVIITQAACPLGTKAAADANDERTVRGLLGAPWFQRVIFGDRVMELGQYELPKYALSPDGTRLAVVELATEEDDRQDGRQIRINGVDAYAMPFGTICHLEWLNNERLAWSGYNRDEKTGIHHFVNGVETTGEVEFESVIGGVRLWERGTFAFVREDGTREFVRPMSERVWRNEEWEPTPARPEWPTERRLGKNRRGKLVITYRGREYPSVHEIETRSGTSSGFAFSADRSKVAYVAIQPSRVVDGLGLAFMAPIMASDAVDAWAREPCIAAGLGHFGDPPPPARRVVAGVVKAVCWAPSWIAALLCNPYVGPLHIASKVSKRWVPMNNGKRWRKGYLHASDHFYTPSDELVVTVTDADGKERVVIDEDEGPPFDAVQNVRFLASEGCVTYCARRGDDIFRVTVHR